VQSYTYEKDVLLRGLCHEIELKDFDKNTEDSSGSNHYRFLIFKDEPLMSCQLCHFQSCEAENK
jgi:hypothetical protein